jgi:hypothetical protein
VMARMVGIIEVAFMSPSEISGSPNGDKHESANFHGSSHHR